MLLCTEFSFEGPSGCVRAQNLIPRLISSSSAAMPRKQTARRAHLQTTTAKSFQCGSFHLESAFSKPGGNCLGIMWQELDLWDALRP